MCLVFKKFVVLFFVIFVVCLLFVEEVEVMVLQEFVYFICVIVLKFEFCFVQSERVVFDRFIVDVVFLGVLCSEEICDFVMVSCGQVVVEYFYGVDCDGDCCFEVVSDFEVLEFFRVVVQFDCDFFWVVGLSVKEVDGFMMDVIMGVVLGGFIDYGFI